MTTIDELRAERDELMRRGNVHREAQRVLDMSTDELLGRAPAKPAPAKRTTKPAKAAPVRPTERGETKTVAECRRIYYGGSAADRLDLMLAMRAGELRIAR